MTGPRNTNWQATAQDTVLISLSECVGPGVMEGTRAKSLTGRSH